MHPSVRDRYIDLLTRVVINSIYCDPSIHPDNTGIYRPELREQGLDWPAVGHSMVGQRRIENLRGLAQQALEEGVPGDFIETGVWRGGCCILMRGILAAYDVSDRKVYACDSFEGLPPPNPKAFPADEGLNLQEYKELSVSLDQVKSNFSRYGLLDEQVVFVKGWFSETLPKLEVGSLALMRLDGDLYESTSAALESLYPKLSSGGFVIIDDYHAFAACAQAVENYRAQNNIHAPLHQIDWAGSWWRKP